MKTVFDRCNIVNESDIAGALGRVHLSHSSAIETKDAASYLVPEVGVEPTLGVNRTGF